MNTRSNRIVAAIAATLFANPLAAKTLNIGLDMSGSNPLVRHEHFAASAGDFLSERINALSDGDVVVIKTFGAREDADNLRSYRYVISRRQSAKKVAAAVSQYLGSFPAKGFAGQPATNLLSWLEFTSGFDCANAGEIIAVTDGVESSEAVDGHQLLSGGAALPDPEIDLSGCQITFWGIGAGLSHSSIRSVRKAWSQWVTDAGAVFTPITP